jgi:hypothetical protein
MPVAGRDLHVVDVPARWATGSVEYEKRIAEDAGVRGQVRNRRGRPRGIAGQLRCPVDRLRPAAYDPLAAGQAVAARTGTRSGSLKVASVV